jgi:hypothetical protein
VVSSLTYGTLNESAGFRTRWVLQLTCCFTVHLQNYLHTFCSFSILRGEDNTGSSFVFMYGLVFRAVSILVQWWDDWWLMTWTGFGSKSDAYLALYRRISMKILTFITRNCRVAYVPTEFRTSTLQTKQQKNSWFQTFALFWMLYAFFWVISRCLSYIYIYIYV